MMAQVIKYEDTVDEYGAKKTAVKEILEAEMRIYIHSQTNVSDPRYVDCDYIGLIRDNFITVNDDIKFDDISCNVKYIIPSPRYTQIFMKKKI